VVLNWIFPETGAILRRKKNIMKKHNLGIVLGGGGARGFAHLGIMEALYEQISTRILFRGSAPDRLPGYSLPTGNLHSKPLKF